MKNEVITINKFHLSFKKLSFFVKTLLIALINKIIEEYKGADTKKNTPNLKNI